MEQALPARISRVDLSQMSCPVIRETVNNLRAICGLEPDSTLIKASLQRLMDKYERIWEYTRAWLMDQELKSKKEKEMSKKKDAKQTEMKADKKKEAPKAADKPAETPKVVEITDRMALLALAQVVGWESNDPFIGNSPEDVVKVTAEDGTETELKAMTDDQCKMELVENLGILTPEDQKAVEAMPNGPAIWSQFVSLREDLSKAKVEAGKKETKEAKKDGKTDGAEKPKKKGPPPRDADPSKSNKGQVYLAWKAGETDIDKLHKKVNEAVNIGTIKAWIGQWKNGKNLPAVAAVKE